LQRALQKYLIGRVVNLLVLANGFVAQYRVLRCAAALGADIYVAGSEYARPLALSRYCKSFQPFSFELEDESIAAAQLDALAAQMQIDMILPGDFQTTLYLARIRGRLETDVFPMPDHDALEQLGTKDRFMAYCTERGLQHPKGQVFASRDALGGAVVRSDIRLPAMAKPVNRAGSIGVVRLDASNASSTEAALDYAPILVQDFIEGEDRSITIFCRDGKVEKQVVYHHPNDVFQFVEEPELAALAADIAQDLNLEGVINFDARIDSNGDVWLIECNPRFYFNMDVAMVAGLNFADLAASGRSLEDQTIRIPQALLRDLLKLELPTSSDLKMLGHWLRDPLMFALVALGYQRKWRAPWFEKVVAGHKSAA